MLTFLPFYLILKREKERGFFWSKDLTAPSFLELPELVNKPFEWLLAETILTNKFMLFYFVKTNNLRSKRVTKEYNDKQINP